MLTNDYRPLALLHTHVYIYQCFLEWGLVNVDVQPSQMAAAAIRATGISKAFEEYGGSHPFFRMPDRVPRYECSRDYYVNIPDSQIGPVMTWKAAE